MDHHDTAALRQEMEHRRNVRAIQQRQQHQNHQSQQQPPTPLSPSPFRAPLNTPMVQASFNATMEQDIAGMGFQYGQFPHDFGHSLPAGVPQSTYGNQYDTSNPMNFEDSFQDDLLSSIGVSGPSTTNQEGALLAIGVLRASLNMFACQYGPGRCDELFTDPEPLQSHFESHAAFTRINPPIRWICPDARCHNMNDALTKICTNMGCPASPETWVPEIWIYGRYQLPSNERRQPDDDPFLSWGPESPVPNIMFTLPSRANTTDMTNLGAFGGNNFDQGGNSSNGYYSYQSDNTYGHSPGGNSPQGGNDYQGYDQGPSNYQYQGNNFCTSSSMTAPAVQLAPNKSATTSPVFNRVLLALVIALYLLVVVRASFTVTLLQSQLLCLSSVLTGATLIARHVSPLIKLSSRLLAQSLSSLSIQGARKPFLNTLRRAIRAPRLF